MLQQLMLGAREFNKLLEAGVLLYQLMGNAGGGWPTNEKIHNKYLCIKTLRLNNIAYRFLQI